MGDQIQMKISIRRATVDDVQLIAEMGARLFEVSFGAFNRPRDMQVYLEKSFNQQDIRTDLLSEKVIYLLAMLSEQVIGYAKVSQCKAPVPVIGSNPIELDRIYIDLAYSNRGYGSQLLTACTETARQLGGDTLWLGVWDRNERAIRFYQQWGFEIVGEMEFVLGDDVQNDYVMARSID